MGGTGKMGKGAIANRSYLRRATEAAATKATTLYEMSKAYTPTKVLALEEHLEERLKGLEEKAQLLNCSTQVISRIDQKQDTSSPRTFPNPSPEPTAATNHSPKPIPRRKPSKQCVTSSRAFFSTSTKGTNNTSSRLTRVSSCGCQSVIPLQRRPLSQW